MEGGPHRSFVRDGAYPWYSHLKELPPRTPLWSGSRCISLPYVPYVHTVRPSVPFLWHTVPWVRQRRSSQIVCQRNRPCACTLLPATKVVSWRESHFTLDILSIWQCDLCLLLIKVAQGERSWNRSHVMRTNKCVVVRNECLNMYVTFSPGHEYQYLCVYVSWMEHGTWTREIVAQGVA
jgi:hypothetical protein